MNKTWIIIQREFAVRVKKKAFILLTILMPFMIAAVVLVPALLGQLNDKKHSKVAVIDATGIYADALHNTDKITFDRKEAGSTQKNRIKSLLEDGEKPYDAVVDICSPLDKAGAVTVYSTSEVPHEVEEYINSQLTERLRRDKLRAYHIADIEQLQKDAGVKFKARTVRWDKDGNTTVSSSMIAGMIGLVLSLFIYTFILSYGSMVMQGVMEEKTNRIVEIMVSSVKPYQLMFGKIAGIALVGLSQFLIWMLMLMSIFSIVGAAFGLSMSGGMPSAVPQSMPATDEMELLMVLQGMDFTQIVVLFILYFIGGYLLFASVFAAIGASINEQQDSQQFMMPIIIIFVFALYAGMFSIENPDGPLALWCSFIPFTSPVVMMVRIPFGIPLWQVILSLLLLYGTSALIIWLSARIYRVGILMYGKKPDIKEMLKWITYK